MNKLLNFSTSIAAEKTVSEIQTKLAQAGASQILHGYDHAGNLNELSFRIKTQFGELSNVIDKAIARSQDCPVVSIAQQISGNPGP